MVKPHRATRNSGGAKLFSPITKSDSDSCNLLKSLGASNTNGEKKSVKVGKRFLRVDSDEEEIDDVDDDIQDGLKCDESLETIEEQISQKKISLHNLHIETTKLEKLKEALQASVLRQRKRRLVAIAGAMPLSKQWCGGQHAVL